MLPRIQNALTLQDSPRAANRNYRSQPVLEVLDRFESSAPPAPKGTNQLPPPRPPLRESLSRLLGISFLSCIAGATAGLVTAAFTIQGMGPAALATALGGGALMAAAVQLSSSDDVSENRRAMGILATATATVATVALAGCSLPFATAAGGALLTGLVLLDRC